MANSIFIWPGVSSTTGGGGASFAGAVTAGSAATGSFYAADGTAALPSYSFTSEPTLGFYRSGAATITMAGNLIGLTEVRLTATGLLDWAGRAVQSSPSNGNLVIQNNALAIGSQLKVDALPTIASGGGGTVAASVTAGSTPLAGSVNVGTGVIASPIVINFNGTAFPSAPFAICNDGQTAIAVRATASTTQLTLTSAAFVANDVIAWHCISSK